MPDFLISGNSSGSIIPEYVRATRESPSRHQRAILESPVQSRKIKPLSEIIAAFKTTSSKRIHQAGYPDFKWKRSFNDRILRDHELGMKRGYIQNNPQKFKNKS